MGVSMGDMVDSSATGVINWVSPAWVVEVAEVSWARMFSRPPILRGPVLYSLGYWWAIGVA